LTPRNPSINKTIVDRPYRHAVLAGELPDGLPSLVLGCDGGYVQLKPSAAASCAGLTTGGHDPPVHGLHRHAVPRCDVFEAVTCVPVSERLDDVDITSAGSLVGHGEPPQAIRVAAAGR
jgi:hypothetical protein